MRNRWTIPLAAFALMLAACSDDSGVLDPSNDPSFGAAASAGQGNVYVMSNASAGNEVIAFDRAPDGTLTPAGSYATNGYGNGGGLGNQGGLVASHDGSWLFAVNAGSNDISSFYAGPNGLRFADIEGSGGVTPVSLTVHQDLLYVVNAGGTGNISGFRVGPDGELTPLAGSTRPLGSSGAAAAQIQFSPDGRKLVVTEKATNTISTYVVGHDGLAYGPNTQASLGLTPFGFDFTQRGILVVSEAAGGSPAASSVSSYSLDAAADLEVITGALGTTQTAACWLIVSRTGRLAFSANTPNASISSFRIGPDGGLSLFEAQAALTGAGSAPVSMALSAGDRFLYVRNSGTGNVGAYAVSPDGGLTYIGDYGSLPASANGIVAR